MRKDYDNIDEFIGVLLEKGIGKVAFTRIDEKRAVVTGGGMIEVIPCKKLEVLAYKNSVIYGYVDEGDVDFDEVFRRIKERGIEPVKRSRNIL